MEMNGVVVVREVSEVSAKHLQARPVMSAPGIEWVAGALILGVLCGAAPSALAAPFERAGLIRIPASQYENFIALSREERGPDPAVLARGLRAFSRARARHQITRNVLTLIDYRLPSDERRLWVMDLEVGRVLFHELVAHGENTGKARARAFSNRMGSHQSSLGTFVTGATYVGQHGYSLRLQGMDPGINDRAMERAIVIHGAHYVSDDFVARYGRLGRSWGCPALPMEVAAPVIDTIKNGSVIFSYYPDPDLEHHSRYLR
jgi:hypothetical protein